MTNAEKTKLVALKMGWSVSVDITGPIFVTKPNHKKKYAAIFNPYTNANDDVAVLDYVMKNWNKFDISLFKLKVTMLEVRDEDCHRYHKGDYTTATAAVIERDDDGS